MPTWPGWGLATSWINWSKEPRVPTSASVPIAVQTCARIARWTASFKARDATEAENAVPLRIPRCSFDFKGIGSILYSAKASREDTIWRAPNTDGPLNTRMEGFPTRVPAMYDNGDRSMDFQKLVPLFRIRMKKHLPPEAEILPRRGTTGVILLLNNSFIFSISSHLTPEWPRMREFIRIKIAPRTHDSGILVEAKGSSRGRASSVLVDEGRIPTCWCWRRACPSARSLSVRVSAVIVG